jgi:hypothetical protein
MTDLGRITLSRKSGDTPVDLLKNEKVFIRLTKDRPWSNPHFSSVITQSIDANISGSWKRCGGDAKNGVPE